MFITKASFWKIKKKCWDTFTMYYIIMVEFLCLLWYLVFFFYVLDKGLMLAESAEICFLLYLVLYVVCDWYEKIYLDIGSIIHDSGELKYNSTFHFNALLSSVVVGFACSPRKNWWLLHCKMHNCWAQDCNDTWNYYCFNP